MIIEIIGTSIGLIAAGVGVYFAWKYSFGTSFSSKPKEGITPISFSKLKSKISALNNKNPFSLKDSSEEGFDLEIIWDVVDAKWREVFGKSWQNVKYTAKVVFDENSHTVKYSEKLIQKEMSTGPLRVHGETRFQKGFLINTRIKSYMYGIKEDGSIGEVFKYDFAPDDIKGVLRQIANENGWTFEVYAMESRIKKK